MKNTQSHFKLLFLLTVYILCSTFCYSQNATDEPNKLIETTYFQQADIEYIPIIPFGDTLFVIHTGMGSFSAKERALSIEDKIKMLGSNLLFKEDSLKLVDYSGVLSIMYQHSVIMSIDTLQVNLEGKNRVEVAQNYRRQIIEAVYQQHKNTSWQHILLQIAGCVAILVSEFFIFRGIQYIYRRVRVKVRLQRGKRIKGLFGIVDAQRSVWAIISVLKFIRLLLVIIFLYLGLLALFKLFPYTKHISDLLLSYIEAPLRSSIRSIIDYMPKLITIIVIVVIFRYTRKFIRSIAEKVAEHKIIIKGFYSDWAFPTYNIIRVILFIFMFILIFPYLPEAESHIFQGVSVFAGIMLSLGSTSIIGNLVAGLVITYMRPFKIGDRIKIGEFTGNVLEKTALVTRIKTPKNEIITIPNSKVMSAQTVNYSFSAEEYGLILYATVDIGYDTPWQKAHEMLLEAAGRTPNLSRTQKPFVLQDAFNDFYVVYQLNVYTNNADLTAKIYSDLRQNIQDVFAENGVDMVSPHYRVSLNPDENESLVPPPYKKKE